MARLSAATLLLHANGTNPGMDSAYTPELPAVVVCPQLNGRAAARFGSGKNQIVGQSYEQGKHPPR